MSLAPVPALTGEGAAGSISRLGEGCLLLALVAGGSADAETDPAAGEETTAATVAVAVAVVVVVAAAERSGFAEDDNDADEAELDSAESNGAEFDSGVDDDRGDGVEEEAEGTGGGESGRLLTGAVLGGDGMEAGDMVTGGGGSGAVGGGVRCCRCICCCCWMGDRGWWRCVGCRWP